MTDYRGVTWRVNYGEISERDQFRVGYINQESYDGYFELSSLADLISVLNAVVGLNINQIARGTSLQARKVSDGLLTSIRIEPRLDTGDPPRIMQLKLVDLTDFLYALGLFQADLANAYPDDWDISEKLPVAVLDTKGKLPEAAIPNRLSDSSLNDAYVPKSFAPVNLLRYATTFPSDQTAAIQMAIDATPAGGSLEVPAGLQFRADGQLNITKTITIFSSGRGGFYSQVSGTTAQRLLRATSGDVHLRGLKLKGSQFAVSANQYAISFIGASAASYIENVSVEDCDISEFAYAGIFAQYVNYIAFNHNRVHDIGYAGIMTASCSYGSIDDNDVWNITQATGYVNSYGITASRTPGSLVDQPRSARLSIKSNRVSNVPLWVGIDTHGGQGLVIASNIVTNCGTAISLVSAQDAGLSYVFAPLDMEVTNNVIDSSVTDGSRGAGINLTGAAAQRATGKITHNTVRGHGLQSAGSGAGIYIENTEGAIVIANRVIEPGVSGITAYANNVDFVIAENVIVDQWSNTVNTKTVNIQVDNNTGYVGENTARTAGKTGTYTAANGFGVFIANQATNIISLGSNRMGVTVTPLYDPGAKARLGFFGATPVAKPSAYTQTYSTASRTHAAYTPNDKSAAFTGVPAALTDAATLADLNALRVALENLRVHHQSTAQVLNSVVDDLQAEGLVG